MRILFCGDIVGRSGREAVAKHVPRLRREFDLDLVIVNGENAAGGVGITEAIANEIYKCGVDVITTGNHVWDQRELIGTIERDPKLLRPQNFPAGTPGRGVGIYPARGGQRAMVLNIMGRLFMDPLDDPFACATRELQNQRLGASVGAIILDFHAEATSEKMAMAHYLDGKVSLVVGTHTHVPTADHQILPGGTAYMSDAGMCGDYNSVIGMEKAIPIARFTRKLPTERLSAAQGEATLCALLVETDEATGLARRIEPIRLGGRLSQAIPAADAWVKAHPLSSTAN